jgi:hypothetical protein
MNTAWRLIFAFYIIKLYQKMTKIKAVYLDGICTLCHYLHNFLNYEEFFLTLAENNLMFRGVKEHI